MKWKTKWGKCIYTSPSGYKVYQNLFYIWLTLGSDALQTLMSRRKPGKPVLYYIPIMTSLAVKYSGPTCLLGLGGASIPHYLHSKLINSSLRVIESSEEVITIAKQFFKTQDIPNLHIIHQNAYDYLNESSDLYKHLLIDLSDANYFPAECNNEQFFINAKNKLQEDGFLVMNLANYQEQWPIFNIVRHHFKNILIIPIKKSANMILIASLNPNYQDFINKVQSSFPLKKIEWLEAWGFVGQY